MAAAIATTRVGQDPAIAVDCAGSGPLVVFLHGIGGGRRNWRAQVPAIAAAGFTAVAWDARGYGDSDDYAGALAFADFSADLNRLLDHFGAVSAHLVGLSMGGRIAMDFYARHPARVRTLCLADTSGGSQAARDPAQIKAFLDKRKAPLLAGKTPADIAPDIADGLLGPNATADQRQALIDSLSALHGESYMKTLDCVTAYHDFPPLEAITAPCLVIGGSEDPIAPPSMLAAMAASIPDARHIVLEGAGHLSNIEQPEAFNTALRAFLAEHEHG